MAPGSVYIYICRTHLSQRIKPMAKTGYIAFVNRSQLSKCYDRLHPAIILSAPPRPSSHLRATYVTITRSIAPRHPISYPYVRTYVHAAPRGAARDVIKWAWSNFARVYILQPPLCQNPAYASVRYILHLHPMCHR